jgi:hypothetical protein
MPAKFYLDTNGSARHAAGAIEILRSDQSTTDLTKVPGAMYGIFRPASPPYAPQYRTPQVDYMSFAGNCALFMMGTSQELLDALDAASPGELERGLGHIAPGGGIRSDRPEFAINDYAVWFVRRKAGGLATPLGTVGGENKTVACIASLSQYWGLTENNPFGGKDTWGNWSYLTHPEHADGVYEHGFDIGMLRDVLWGAHGTDPWY